MAKRVVYEDNGQLIVLSLHPDFIKKNSNDEDRALEAMRQKDVPPSAQGTEIIIEEEDLPDRYFREAWKIDQGRMDIDLPKARAYQMSVIRKVRDEELEKTDHEAIEALTKEDNIEFNRVKADKQDLRDIPANVDLDSKVSPEEIKGTWPARLERRAARTQPLENDTRRGT